MPIIGLLYTLQGATTLSRRAVYRPSPLLRRGPQPPTSPEVAALESRLPPSPDGTKTELRIGFVETLIINRDGDVTGTERTAEPTKGTF